MYRITALAAGLAGLFALGSAAPAGAQVQAPQPPVISTQGDATIKRAPDRAWVLVATESRAPKPADAQRLGAAAMTGVQSSLKARGVPIDAIRTVSYSLQPDMEYSGGTSRVKGYIVRNQIEVRVDVLDQLGDVLDAAGSSGAASIAGLRFDLKSREAVEVEALRTAVQNAMKRAETMAAGAGRTLGAIVRIEEISVSAPPGAFMALRADMQTGASTPIVPGEVEITARVALTISIR